MFHSSPYILSRGNSSDRGRRRWRQQLQWKGQGGQCWARGEIQHLVNVFLRARERERGIRGEGGGGGEERGGGECRLQLITPS